MERKSKMLMYLLVLIILVGCKSKPHNKEAFKKKDIAPKSLQELSKEIASIMDYAGDIEKIDLDMYEDQKEEKDKEKKIKEDKPVQDQSGQQSGQDQSSSQNDGGQGSTISTQESKDPSGKSEKPQAEPSKEEIKDEKIEAKWKDIDKKLESVHLLWNEYEVKGVKMGATAEKSEEVEDALNKLTKGVEDREIFTVYNHGSRSFKALKPYYELYKDEIGGEVVNLKYMVYQYYINAVKESKNTAKMYIENSEEDINKIRLKWEDKKDKKEKIDKVSFGFKNLSNALTEDSRRLFILKKDVLIKNLDSLEN